MFLPSRWSSPLSLHPTTCQIHSLCAQARMWPLQENRTRPPAPARTALPEASVWERGRNSVDDSTNTAMLTLEHLLQKSRTTFRLAKSSAGSTSFQNIFSKQLSIISSDFTCSCAVFISFNDRLSYLAVLQLSQVVSSWLSSKMPEQHKEEILSLPQVLTQRHIPTGEQDNHYFAEIWTEIASIHSTLNWIWIDKKRNLLQFKEIQRTVVTWTIYLQMHI